MSTEITTVTTVLYQVDSLVYARSRFIHFSPNFDELGRGIGCIRFDYLGVLMDVFDGKYEFCFYLSLYYISHGKFNADVSLFTVPQVLGLDTNR